MLAACFYQGGRRGSIRSRKFLRATQPVGSRLYLLPPRLTLPTVMSLSLQYQGRDVEVEPLGA